MLVIDGPSEAETEAAAEEAAADASTRAAEMRAAGASAKDIRKALMAEFGLSRNDAYALALGE